MTSIDDIAWPVRTERLSFRPAEPADAPAFHAYRRLPEVAEWLPRISRDEADAVARFTDEDFRRRTFVIEVDGAVVGDLYLQVSPGWVQAEAPEELVVPQGEIGWVLAPDHQCRGLALEAVQRLLRLCFEELGLRRVTATCFADNTASWRLMERLGMRRESHTVKDALHRDRGWLDGYTYALLAEEWAERSGS